MCVHVYESSCTFRPEWMTTETDSIGHLKENADSKKKKTLHTLMKWSEQNRTDTFFFQIKNLISKEEKKKLL